MAFMVVIVIRGLASDFPKACKRGVFCFFTFQFFTPPLIKSRISNILSSARAEAQIQAKFISKVQQESSISTSDNVLSKSVLHEGQKLAGCYVLKSEFPAQTGRVVWLAHDEVLGKDVTLHFIPPAVLQDARAVAELRQEVKRNRQLIHPNILRVYDFVEDSPYAAISMDRIEGESLAVLLKRNGPFEPQDVQAWLIQLAETLSDAHRAQFVHRDLAPENFFIRPMGGLLVTNLGIGRTICDAMERAGLAKGADAHLSYTSPQQIDGERPTPSDDVYGLGALSHELLTGSAPFTDGEIVHQIRKVTPPSVSEVRTQLGSSALSQDWDCLVTSCLAKNPDQRPKTCGEVASLLSQAKVGHAVPATSATPASVSDHLAESKAPESVAHASLAASIPALADLRQHAAEVPSGQGSEHRQSSMPPLPHAVPGSAGHKAASKPSLSESFPDFDRPKSKAPAVLVGLAAVLLGVGVYMKQSGADTQLSEESSDTSLRDGQITAVSRETSEVQAAIEKASKVKPASAEPAQSATQKLPDEKLVDVAVSPKGSPSELAAQPDSKVPAELAKPPQAKPPVDTYPLLPVVVLDDPAVKSQNPLLPAPEVISKPAKTSPPAMEELPNPPTPLPKLTLPPKATVAQLEQLLAERQAAAMQAQEIARTAEAAQMDASQRRDRHAAELEQMTKTAAEKRKEQASAIQQASAIEVQRKKLDDEKNRAKAAAMEAVKAAESAEKAFADAMEQGADKIAARQMAEMEMADLSKGIAERTKALDDSSGQSTKADSLRQQMQLALRQIDMDKQSIAAALGKVKTVEDEVKRRANRDKIVALENEAKPLEVQAEKIKDALLKLKELGDAGTDAAKPLQQKLDSLNGQIGTIHLAIKDLGNSSAGNPVSQPPLAPPSATQGAAAPLPAAPEAASSTNSLGMKFVAVGDIQFAIHPTTRQQFEAFAKSANLKNATWQTPGFKQDSDHPVVNVTWREAEAFCKWLTVKERTAKLIKPDEAYRLPSDLEWSKAVGLPLETGKTPEDRDMEVQGVYPWGTELPPPDGGGNYAGEETEADTLIAGYNDGYKNTSPVGKFKSNAYGLYDMGGNVWQWVQDDWNAEKRSKTLRGASWYNGAIPLTLLSSCRIGSSPETPNDTYGFRVVKVVDPAKPARR